MPLYEYQCKSCHSLTERIQKFSDPPLTTCPHCGGELEQVLSAPAVQFKGARLVCHGLRPQIVRLVIGERCRLDPLLRNLEDGCPKTDAPKPESSAAKDKK